MTLLQKKWSRLAALLAIASIPIAGYAFSNAKFCQSAQGEASGVAMDGAGFLTVETFELGTIAPPEQLDWYRGTIVPSKEADLGFRRGGRIDRVNVQEGDRVQRGDTLATLDSSDVESKLQATLAAVKETEAMLAELVAGPRKQTIDAARSEVTRLEAALALSQVTADRQRSLFRSNASSVQQFDEARFSVEQSASALESARHRLSELNEGTRKEQIDAQKARVEVLRAQVDTLNVDLNDSRIVAPFDGLVSRRSVDEGTIAGPQSVVLRLIQCDPLEASFGVAPSDARMLQTGDHATVTVDDNTIEATVARIEPELDATSRTQKVFLALPGAFGRGVVPGQTASLAVAREREDSMWVPITSLSRAARGLWAVDVVSQISDGMGIVERRQVQVLESDTDVAKIAGTMVKPGDHVVRSGINRITPGMKVVISDLAEPVQP
jgi:RND family efflux transporter MFP subunit